MKYSGEILKDGHTFLEFDVWPHFPGHVFVTVTTPALSGEWKMSADEAREIARHLNAAAEALALPGGMGK